MRFHVSISGPDLGRAVDAIKRAGIDIESLHGSGPTAVLIASMAEEDAFEAERQLARMLPPGYVIGPARSATIQDQ